ncbi:LysR family transcriptional regulator [Labrenzia sp. CE80]|uniref:LysR family transcriptional regulator n=1 Tax=Labrenzia sp. CE80 TaxID=1788986 RepID=UPI00129AA66D|nr:LysR family transcriptional regulator [Labrenzia sp. CE80]
MDWENLHIFALLARHGTLSAAGRAAGVEHATVSRRVANLERELGLKLVDRRGRYMSLTAEGERIAAIAARIETEALSVERIAVGGRSSIAGEVVISAPPGYVQKVLGRQLASLALAHPALCVTVLGETQEISLARREADIAIRLNRPVVGDLSITKIDEIEFSFYAAEGYVERTAKENWRFVGYDHAMDNAPQQRKLIEFAAGRPFGFRASALDLQLHAVSAGVGIGFLPNFMGASAAGLVPLIGPKVHFKREVWLVVHPDIRQAPAIRATVNALAG